MADRKNLLVIGCGSVGQAVVHKVAQHNDEFGDITIASLHKGKCEQAIRSAIEKGNVRDPSRKLVARELDAMDADAVARAIEEARADIVINVASPYTNMSVMTGCLKAGAHYLDTAVYEEPDKLNQPAPWYALHEWKRKEEFEKAGLTCILSIGCDPGMVNVFVAYAQKHLLDTIETIDIMDVNAGSHNRFFATNFDPEINLREILEDVIYWEDGEWKVIPHHSMKRTFNFPEVGEQTVYAMGHEEVHSLAVNVPARRVQFWMGFSDHYIQVFNTLEKLGLLGIEPVEVDGCKVIPIRLLKKLLPDPTTLAAEYRGKVCVGDLVCGEK
ncbi:MAG: saccharopine dehydrogenase family protein, partial [Zetaproteobacteria bacterium]